MGSPLLGDDASFASETSGAWEAPRRNRTRAVSLFWARAQRAVRRQAGVAVIAFILTAGVGLIYGYAGGVAVQQLAPMALAIGLAVALLISIATELGRNTVTSVGGLRKQLGCAVLGVAPELTAEALRQLPPEHRTPLGCLTLQPGSPFATAFRNLQARIADGQVVAVVGSISNEGASTSALGAAISATQQGRRVLLVDCDLRRRSLTRALVGDAQAGTLEAADRPQNLRTLIHREAETGLHFLPAAKLKSAWMTLTGMAGLPILVNEMRKAYDLVVLDCPPTLGSADGAMLARLADGCIIVAAWDDTPMGALRAGIRALGRGPKAAAGIYLNRFPSGYRL